MLLFHGSPEPDLQEIRESASSYALVDFGGLFFSGSRKAAESMGRSIYVVDIDERNIARSFDLQYGLEDDEVELIESILREEYGETNDELWELVAGDNAEAFESEIEPGDWGEFLWEAQRVRGRVARALGYDAVEMDDEFGTSYLVFPGVGLRHARHGER